MNADASMRKTLLSSLEEGGAHISFAAAVKDFPAGLRGRRLPGVPPLAGSARSAVPKVSVSAKIIARSSRFSNSRTLPGKG